VERASEHEIIIAGQLAQACVELSVVYEPSGFADDEERKNHPDL
jgi:hypothetical protein